MAESGIAVGSSYEAIINANKLSRYQIVDRLFKFSDHSMVTAW